MSKFNVSKLYAFNLFASLLIYGVHVKFFIYVLH